MLHHLFQAQFSEALISPISRHPSRRFAIYRNNVFVGLVEALCARYPALENAVGTEFFHALARDYAAHHQPNSPVMMHYGANFPDFIAACDVLRDYSWLSDLARLEMIMTEVYHARDQQPIPASAFAGLTPESLSSLRVRFIDACAILKSEFPLVALWQMNTGQIEPAPIDDLQPEAALIYRDGYDVAVRALARDDAVFVTSLRAGDDLSVAMCKAQDKNTMFDPNHVLSFIIRAGLILSIDTVPLENFKLCPHSSLKIKICYVLSSRPLNPYRILLSR